MTKRRCRARGLGAIAGAVGLAAFSGSAAATPRIVSLDQCADQYVLALAWRGDIVALSRRATQSDSALRVRAAGLRQVRPDLETLLGLRPGLVVRTWGGDGALVTALAARGIRTLTLPDPATFAAVRSNIRRAALSIGARTRGEALIARMNSQLSDAAGAGGGVRALYLSAAGETAGPDTLMGAILAAAGYRDAETRAGYRAVSLERLILSPPRRIVAAFFDVDPSVQRWSMGRQAALRGMLAGRAIARLPASDLACPSWTAGDAVARLASAARRP